MIDTLEPQWIWQAKAWPNFHPDPQVLAGPLARARLAQGKLMGKAEAVGAAGFVGTRQEIWTGCCPSDYFAFHRHISAGLFHRESV